MDGECLEDVLILDKSEPAKFKFVIILEDIRNFLCSEKRLLKIFLLKIRVIRKVAPSCQFQSQRLALADFQRNLELIRSQ